MANKKRIATSVAAVATAAALLLGGTFAWQSISQTALNEASDVINPGGRLHDDFNGSDKNVYVENFAEDEIFARVRFDEYFEIVMNYGGDAEKSETIVGGVRNDPSTYEKHIFGEDNPTDPYWDWTMGGQDPDAGDVYYMPTFNLNKDSLAADVNGVFDGANFIITDQDHDQYANYVEWIDGATKDGYEIYDGDTNNEDELSEQANEIKEINLFVNDIIDNGDASPYYNAANLELTDEQITHYAELVNPETDFMSMADWQVLPEDEKTGPYWVYDTDGWCYWAQAIPAGETTGLLMDGIALDGVMDDTWYYAINVVGQFITANDIGDGSDDNPGFVMDGMTPEAEALLKEIGVDVDGTGTGDEGGDEDNNFVDVGTLTGINMSLYSDNEYIKVDKSTNTLLVDPEGGWQKVLVNLEHDTLDIILNDTTQAIYQWDDATDEYVEHDESIVDIAYHEDGLDLYLCSDSAGRYKLTASYSNGENTYDGSIEFTIVINDNPGTDDGGDDDQESPIRTYTLVPGDDERNPVYRDGNVIVFGNDLYFEVYDEDGEAIDWNGVTVSDEDGVTYAVTTEGIETHYDWDEEDEITPQAKITIPENTAPGELTLAITTADETEYYAYIRVIQPYEISLYHESSRDEYFRGDSVPMGEYIFQVNYSEWESGYPDGEVTLTYYDGEGDPLGDPLSWDEPTEVSIDNEEAEYFVVTHDRDGDDSDYVGTFYISDEVTSSIAYFDASYAGGVVDEDGSITINHTVAVNEDYADKIDHSTTYDLSVTAYDSDYNEVAADYYVRLTSLDVTSGYTAYIDEEENCVGNVKRDVYHHSAVSIYDGDLTIEALYDTLDEYDGERLFDDDLTVTYTLEISDNNSDVTSEVNVTVNIAVEPPATT